MIMNMNSRGPALGLIATYVVSLLCVVLLGLANPGQAHSAPSLTDIPGVPDPCDILPSGAAEKICDVATDPAGEAIDAVPGLPNPSEVIGNAIDSATRSFLEEIVAAEAEAVAFALVGMVKVVDSTTDPDFTQEWFIEQYRWVFGMAVLLALILGFSRFASGVGHKNTYEMSKGIGGLAIFVVVGGAIPLIVAIVTRFFDSVATEWMLSRDGDTEKELQALSSSLVESSAVGGVGAVFLLLLVLFVGAIGALGMELIFYLRELALYVVTIALVVALALRIGGKWSGEAFERVVLTALALAMLKFMAAVILVTGLNLASQAEDAVDVAFLATALLLGFFVLLFAGFRLVSRHDVRPNFERNAMRVWSGASRIVRN